MCHICQGFRLSAEMGSFLGGTFVDIFLLLSAYLLGLNSRDKIANNPKLFLIKRSKRLIPTYYIYLTISFLIIVLYVGTSHLNIKQILGHIFFLNWFWKSARIGTSLGHLWFMSCIIMSYILVTIWAILIKKIKFLNTTTSWIIYFLIVGTIALLMTSRSQHMIYPFTIVLGFVIIFFRGKEIMEWLNQISSFIRLLFFFGINILSILIYLDNGFYDCPGLVFWINLLNSLLWISCASIIFKVNENSVIYEILLFLSSISFEIYLVHHPLCLGPLSLHKYFPLYLAIPLVFIFSIFFGWVLSRITSFILKHLYRS